MTTPMSDAEIRAAIERVPVWRHAIELAPGIVTPGYPTVRKLRRLRLPDDLSGKTVLDVGCSDGFFAFECERRGAARVVAFDDWSSPFVDSAEGFRTAHEVLGSKVEHYSLDLLTLDPKELGQFDIVLCLGVLYHLRHPLLGLEQLAALTRETLYLETEVSSSIINRPSMTFIEGLFRNRDLTTWWVPTIAAVQQMARSAGFQHVGVADIYDTRTIFICRKDRELLLREVQSYPPHEIERMLALNGATPGPVESLDTDDLARLRERLWTEGNLSRGKSRTAVPVVYGAYRRVLSAFWNLLRRLGLRFR